MKSIDSVKFITFLRENERWLMERTLKYARQQEYTKYTSTLLEAWRISIVGLTDSLEMLIQVSTELPELTPDEHYDDDPACAFGVKEARLHRSRGVNLAMFFTLFKYYRQSYVELVEEKQERSAHREYILAYMNRFFDRVESAYIIEWAGRSPEEQIHDLAQKNREQANEKNRYLTIFDSMDSASMVISTEGVIENYNLKAGTLFFQDAHEGRYYYGETKRLLLKDVYPVLDTYLHNTGDDALQWQHEERDYSVMLKGLHDISGKSEGWVLLFSDITKLKASETHFRQLYENAPIAYQSLGIDGDMLSVNNRWLEELGYEYEEVLGRNYAEFLTPEYRKKFDEIFSKFIEEGVVSGMEFEMVRKDGRHILVAVDGNVVYDEMGCFLIMHCIFSNITEQRRLHRELEFNQEYLERLFDTTPNIMFTTNGEYLDRANHAMLDSFGYESSEAFKLEHTCICEYFEEGDGFLQVENDGLTWLEYLYAHPKRTHKVQMSLASKRSIFVVSAEKLRLDENSRSVIVFTDVTELEGIRKRYEYALIGANDGLWDWDIPTQTIYFSPRWKSMLGLEEDAIGDLFTDFEALVHPDDMPQVMEKVQKHFDGDVQYTATIRMRHTDGQWRWILTRGKVVERDETGTPLRMVGTHTDITESKENESKMKKLQSLLKNILDSVDNLIFVKDTDFTYIECNPAFEKFIGRSHDEIVGHNDYEFFEKEVADFFRTKDEEMLLQGHTVSNFEWVTYPDGEELYLLTAKAPLYDQSGQMIGLVGNSVDLTMQKRLEERLQSSIIQFERFMENIPGLVAIKDADDKVVYTNTLAAKFFGRESLIGLDANALMPSAVSDQLVALNQKAKAQGYAEAIIPYEDPAHRSYVFRVTTFIIKEEQSVETGSIYLDITEQYRDQQEIVKFKQILERSPMSIVVTDTEGTIEYVNPWFSQVTGYTYEEAIGQNPRILKSTNHTSDEYTKMWEEITSKHVWTGTFNNIKKSGEEFWETALIAPVLDDEEEIVSFIAIKEEITEQIHLREELKDKEEIMIAQSRHAAMGEMISMIAHQWRQPISVIAMGANNILADIDLEQVELEELKVQAKGILNQTLHLSKTIDDFRDFFRPDKAIEEVTPEHVMAEAYKIIGKSLEYANVIYSVRSESSRKLTTFSRELLQVYINLLKNAKEALVEEREKDRKMEVSIIDDGKNIITTICDNGGGIDEAIIDKIFDPYFSTKDEKTGTGLGLYMSKTIIEKHLYGKITVENSKEGACFTVTLPIDRIDDA